MKSNLHKLSSNFSKRVSFSRMESNKRGFSRFNVLLEKSWRWRTKKKSATLNLHLWDFLVVVKNNEFIKKVVDTHIHTSVLSVILKVNGTTSKEVDY